MVNYSAGDFLIQIKNAALADRRDVVTKSTKFLVAIANALKDERYLESVEVKDGNIAVRLTYHKKMPLLTNIKLKSKPGLRLYADVDTLAKRKSASIFILSTPKGVMSSRKAVKARLGGEIIAEVW